MVEMSAHASVQGFLSVARAIAPRGRTWAAAALFAVVGVTASLAQNPDKLQIVTSSGVHPFSVELATNDVEREKGLMYRRYMPRDRGMLFDFKREEPVTFWMKNTYISLDMIFISRSGVVTGIAADAEPLSERMIPSGGPCYAVLEVNAGVAASIELRPGDKIIHSIFAP
jgi:uncharacterized membrane protein (UPF0127 family)